MIPRHAINKKAMYEWLVELESKGVDKAKIERAWNALRSHAMLEFPVVFNPRLTTVAGRAHSDFIELNTELWLGCSPDEFFQTLMHEAAHVMASRETKQPMDHGYGWEMSCLELGIPARRCHNYATMQRRRRR